MHQLKGFHDDENRNKVYKLKKSIYGIKQITKCRNGEIKTKRSKLYGFKQCESDP